MTSACLSRRQTRRTPGLRREEVAELAGISIDYLVRLEQARPLRPSADVVEALARALRLAPDERTYLYDLTQQRPRTSAKAPTTAAPPLAGLVADLSPLPAMLMNHRYDVLAWNPRNVEAAHRFRHPAAPTAQLDVAMSDPSGRYASTTPTANASHGRESPTCAPRGPRIRKTGY